MNALVSAHPREQDVQSKIRKVRAFGRSARTICAVLFWFGLIGIVVVLFVVLRFPVPATEGGSKGVHALLASPLTPLLLKLWTLLGIGAAIGVWLAAMHQLYRLFGNLAAGTIFTTDNVRRVRQVGFLWLLLAVLNVALPATLVIANGLVDASVPLDLDRVFPSFGELLTSFAAAGLVLLVSWIMDIGLYEKQHAEALRRDADLVI